MTYSWSSTWNYRLLLPRWTLAKVSGSVFYLYIFWILLTLKNQCDNRRKMLKASSDMACNLGYNRQRTHSFKSTALEEYPDPKLPLQINALLHHAKRPTGIFKKIQKFPQFIYFLKNFLSLLEEYKQIHIFPQHNEAFSSSYCISLE